MNYNNGRGRGISNTPAWMNNHPGGPPGGGGGPRRGGGGGNNYNHNDPGPPRGPYGNRRGGGGPPRPNDDWRRGGEGDYPPFRGGGGFRGGGRRRGGGPPPPHPPNAHRRPSYGDDRPPPLPPKPGMVTFRSLEEEREWVEDRRRKRLARPSKFDILPTETTTGGGTAIPSAAAAQAAATAAAAALAATLPPTPTAAHDGVGGPSSSIMSQQTRHARRLYVGNLPIGRTIPEDLMHTEFLKALERAWMPDANPTVSVPPSLAVQGTVHDPIVSVYMNHERRFCFVEFQTMEWATACMQLDGLPFCGVPLKIKRPNEYHPSAGSDTSNNLPQLDVSRLGIISSNVLDGPNKIFIGGLHYHLTEAQVLELIQAFGPIKAFHLVKGVVGGDGGASSANDPGGMMQSKGYCFAEYANPQVTLTAIQGLNGMEIGGGRTLTARLAGERGSIGGAPRVTAPPPPPPPPVVVGAPPPDRNIVGGYDIEALVDAAMGKAVMPTAPVYRDAMGQPLTRIVVMNLPPMLSAALGGGGAVPPAPPHASMVGALPPPPTPTGMPVATPPAANPTNEVPPPTAASVPGSSPEASTTVVPPSRVLVLHNMVQPQDLESGTEYESLVEEVRDECTNYGKLERLEIPRAVQQDTGRRETILPSAVGKIYLHYATLNQALRAKGELQGRQFGSAVVQVTFYPEDDFLQSYFQ